MCPDDAHAERAASFTEKVTIIFAHGEYTYVENSGKADTCQEGKYDSEG